MTSGFASPVALHFALTNRTSVPPFSPLHHLHPLDRGKSTRVPPVCLGHHLIRVVKEGIGQQNSPIEEALIGDGVIQLSLWITWLHSFWTSSPRQTLPNAFYWPADVTFWMCYFSPNQTTSEGGVDWRMTSRHVWVLANNVGLNYKHPPLPPLCIMLVGSKPVSNLAEFGGTVVAKRIHPRAPRMSC